MSSIMARHRFGVPVVLLMVAAVLVAAPGPAGAGVDGDGHLDVVFANWAQWGRVCVGDGIGGFSCSSVSGALDDSRGVALGDIDGDGDLDAVFANYGVGGH